MSDLYTFGESLALFMMLEIMAALNPL